ncbi:MAG: hypothetical protein HY232_18715 [Acidobacteria bacterium]|nr:hypothetical protein [Acidobacteriota bacterium]
MDRHGYDIATGYRHYLLSQTRGIIRHIFSHAYRWICKFLLGLGVRDSETGCKFFKRATTTAVVLGCEYDGWFWDTEVMSRAALKNLQVCEMPVLFLRRPDKQSTVHVLSDSWRYLIELHQFRSKVGLGLTGKSPTYWSAFGYDLLMKVLYGGAYKEVEAEVANLIPDGASVVDVCCGSSGIYRNFLKDKRDHYLGLEFNGHFVMAARKRGINVRLFNLLAEEVPPADYVIMCSSFYHFHSQQREILDKLLKAARRGLIISEPVENVSSNSNRFLGRLANLLTNPGIGEYNYRFNLEGFRKFAQDTGATSFLYTPGRRNAIALFKKEPPSLV